MIKEKQTRTQDKKEQLSGKRITELIPKHENSAVIREDIMGYSWGKRGITYNILTILIFALIGVLGIGIFGFVLNSMYAGLHQDIMLGQVNLSNTTEQTLGVVVNSYNNNMDLFGLFLIFGMVVGLFLASFFMRGKWDKILIVVDIFMLIVSYIISIVISNVYETILITSQGVISQFEGDMPKTSNFLLHLPRYTVIIGIVCMILFYSSIPKRESEQTIQYQEAQY